MKTTLLASLALACAYAIPVAAYANLEEKLPEESPFAFSAVSEDELNENTGTGGFSTLNTAELSASNTGNSITTNAPTGSNYISDNAFQNSNGVVNVIQNSGNGVVIQNSTIVNLNMQ